MIWMYDMQEECLVHLLLSRILLVAFLVLLHLVAADGLVSRNASGIYIHPLGISKYQACWWICYMILHLPSPCCTCCSMWTGCY